MRKKRYWEAVWGKMKERAKAVDDYATTFFANNLCKQLMYSKRRHDSAIIVGMQSKAPSNASARNRREIR